jgi:hypothetical protein
VEGDHLSDATPAYLPTGTANTVPLFLLSSPRYWPEAPVDRIVAACSFRAVPPALVAQTRPGGKILLTLSGWLYGYARVLLTVADDGTAEGPLLPGTVSFMPARTHAAPAFGNPAHWAADLPETSRAVRHSPDRITAPTEEGFFLRFFAQCAVPERADDRPR